MTRMKRGETDYQTIQIAATFSINVEGKPSSLTLSDQNQKVIQRLWEQEQAHSEGKLQEGTILSATAYDRKGLAGQFLPYKFLLAQQRDPALKAFLKIVPVGVSSIALLGNDLIIAKRASWLPEYPDCYELPPSGYIRPPAEGRIDLKRDLLEMWCDDLHLHPKGVKSIKFFALLHDFKNDSVKLCAEIKLKSYVIFSSTDHYCQLLTVPAQEIARFVETHSADFVPLSLQILRLRKLL